jgi:hypothetical protein
MDKKKSIWLLGGFGNIMFQMLLVDRFYKKGYKIDIICVLIKKNWLTKLLRWTIHDDLTRYILNKYPNITVRKNVKACDVLHLVMLNFSRIFSITFFGYTFFKDSNNIQLSNSKHIIGYFQTEKFINDYSSEITDIAFFFNSQYPHKNKYRTTVFHFRWGDTYWARKYQNYYLNVKKLLLKENTHIRIVTDDLHKAKEFLGELNSVEFISSSNPFEDFLFLLNAETLILAPSTFSWWAANLSVKANKVIAPKEIISFLPLNNKKIILHEL